MKLRDLRIFGAALLLGGIVLCVFSLRAIANADEMGRFFAEMGAATNRPIDSQQWTEHWRATCLALFILGAGGVIAGLAFIIRHRFAWTYLAATLIVESVCLGWLRTRPATLRV